MAMNANVTISGINAFQDQQKHVRCPHIKRNGLTWRATVCSVDAGLGEVLWLAFVDTAVASGFGDPAYTQVDGNASAI